MAPLNLIMQPAPGERLQRFVGDRLHITLAAGPLPEGWRARLRTNLGRASRLRQEIIQAHAQKLPPAAASWRDLPMQPEAGQWAIDLPLTETGWFKAKAYLIDPQGWQHWPDGADVNISVHPDQYRTGNTIYCAFTRLFGASRTAVLTQDEKQEQQFQQLDQRGYSIIPPSGKFRDLIRQLPHIMDTLGCRILHLLPVHPVPTTFARFGRFGSPYASLDLTAVDPALVEFDRRTTGIQQFCELTHAAHLRGGRVFLDMVINHTGWGSLLQENHPEWFLRGPDGDFVSPGAWGTVWEDLAELEHCDVPLWDDIAQALLTWCRRGVDGFRCDAGYKVPIAAWQYITTRVREEFPETIFLLEGLGGPWEVTERLMAEGGMQWAYSELFQNYSGPQVATYLDYSFKQTGHTGLMVHYSETHDNERLASRGRAWSLLRNRLCALTSVSGGYGFTCGVEWLAPERVNVHSCTGLAWDNSTNLVAELARLNRLLAGHPCFFDGVNLTRLSPGDSPVYALRRDSAEGADHLLVLVNNDAERPQKIVLNAAALEGFGPLKFELNSQPLPDLRPQTDGSLEFTLPAGASTCLADSPAPKGLAGEAYRQARAQAAWALANLGYILSIEKIPALDWRDLAKIVHENAASFLAACNNPDASRIRDELKRLLASASSSETYAPVVIWSWLDRQKILPVPPGHWLLIHEPGPFRATLHPHKGGPQHVQSIPVKDGHIVCFTPDQPFGDANLHVESYAPEPRETAAQIRFLKPGPQINPDFHDGQPLVLLTNGRGGMARLCVDLGAIKSKYDCLLGANLNPKVPVDRHIFAKRARVWINADGFISPLDLRNLVSFQPGPPAVWRFVANAGDGRTVEIELSANMLPGRNTTVLNFTRPTNQPPGKPLPDECDVRLTVRVDIEDRGFHGETKRNGGADYHFNTNTRPLPDRPGFAFTPAPDRHLRAFSTDGLYHPAVEWCENIPHPIEQSRGQVGSGDAYSPGWFDLPLPRGKEISLVVCADDTDPLPDEIQKAGAPASVLARPNDPFDEQLLRAARAFVVRRDDSVTVIAGYPWFLDWGRDSLICARGLLAAGMADEVKQLLITFGRFEKDGTLPNTIHGDDASNRDTSDAPLWYGIVCEEAAAHFGEAFYQTKVDARRTVADVLLSIAQNYSRGTPNGIRLDASSGLIWSPAHFTWMDTNFPAGTPREGYPIEIQVLWLRLLRQLQRCGPVPGGKRWQELAALAETSLTKYFWLEERGWLADLLIAKSGQPAAQAVVDNGLRSNCLFAISLGLLTGERARRCVAAALRYLVIPGALRTLAPLPVSPPLAIYGNQGQLLNNPPEPYWGRYEGDEDTRRKPAYHNGTAWTWTFPVFCEALARAWDHAPEAHAAARAYLGSMDRLLTGNCVGQIPEILDGDAPHTPRGCDAQAWGVTEALRVWQLLQNPPSIGS